MAKATLKLSKKPNHQGEYPIMVRLDISRTNRPQFKSEVSVPSEYFKDGEIVIPSRGKTNMMLRESLLKKKSDIDAFVAMLNAIVLALPEEAHTRASILEVYESVKTLSPSEINRTTIVARKKEESEKKMLLVAQLQEANSIGFVEYIRQRVKGMKDGTIKRKGNNYKKGTIETYKKAASTLERFAVEHPFKWEDINKKLIDDYVLFMEKNEFMKKTINKELASFSALLGWAFKDGYPVDRTVLDKFPKLQVSHDDMMLEIYLTEEEVQSLYEMKLTGMEEKVRDVFLVGCYTSQRYSDYSRIKSTNVTKNEEVWIINLTQMKTGTDVTIPVLNDNLIHILKKYDYNLPHISNEEMNSILKVICKRLSRKVKSLAEEVPTRLPKARKKMLMEGKLKYKQNTNGDALVPRYDLVCSHTARRTGITQMYLSKILDNFEMMSISGHKTESVFREYIKLSGVEMATAIARKVANAKKEQQVKSLLLQQFESMPSEKLTALLEMSKTMNKKQ